MSRFRPVARAHNRDIPRPVIAVAADVLADALTHSKIDVLFSECGAPGDPPVGNKVDKISDWLRRVNEDPEIDGLSFLGCILEIFMETEVPRYGTFGREPGSDANADDKIRIRKILANHGLEYQVGGLIVGGSVGLPAKSFADRVRDADLIAVETEFARALGQVDRDPPAAATAACALLESTLTIFIEDHLLEMPQKRSLKPLWDTVRKHLGIDAATIEDLDLKKIAGGLSSIVDGIASLRTHAGSAHGQGRAGYKLEPRHARLAVHASCTLAIFVIERWRR